MTHPELLKRITARPDVFGGKPIIRDMRLSVELILSLMAQGLAAEAILDEYPELEPDDIRACVAYATCRDRSRHAVGHFGGGTVRFLIDRCAGPRLADWLRTEGHDVLESRELGPDPGDQALLERAISEGRILVTIDTDFGELVYVKRIKHAGLVRLPDVPVLQRIALMTEVVQRHARALEARAVITIRGGRIRIAYPPLQ